MPPRFSRLCTAGISCVRLTTGMCSASKQAAETSVLLDPANDSVLAGTFTSLPRRRRAKPPGQNGSSAAAQEGTNRWSRCRIDNCEWHKPNYINVSCVA
mmetsp:Transcript_253/g.869  ORF Transcript_253/g.869 Transcript_253/m.869 type:complete len:99 (-) Transcript_253:4-300(-)